MINFIYALCASTFMSISVNIFIPVIAESMKNWVLIIRLHSHCFLIKSQIIIPHDLIYFSSLLFQENQVHSFFMQVSGFSQIFSDLNSTEIRLVVFKQLAPDFFRVIRRVDVFNFVPLVHHAVQNVLFLHLLILIEPLGRHRQFQMEIKHSFLSFSSHS